MDTEILNRFEQVQSGIQSKELQGQTLEYKLESILDQTEPLLKKRIFQEYLGEGPLASLLLDHEITEIILNGTDSIWFEKSGRLFRHEDRFLSNLTLENFIHRLCEEAEIETNLKYLSADGSWRGFRVHLSQAPLVNVPYHLCLRRHPESPWTLEALAETGWAKSKDLDLIRGLIRDRKNILVVGPTGCGKTSILNACLQLLPENERAVIIEDTSELRQPNSASVKLLTRKDPHGSLMDFDLSDLVKQALRMRPDRLVMGEVRGPEAKDLLLALATGHQGSLGTIHASDARQALVRLEMLVQLGAPDWSIEAVRQLIHLSLDSILVLEKRQGQRRLKEISQIASLERFGFVLDPL